MTKNRHNNNNNNNRLSHTVAVYKPVALFAIFALILLSVSRTVLAFLYIDRVSNAISWPQFLLLGLRADLIQVSYFVLIPLVLFSPLLFKLNRPQVQRWWRRLWVWWFLCCTLILWFMEVSTPAFIAQYDSRPNRLFFEYLGYPQEVFSTLINGFAIWLVIGLISILVYIGGAYKIINATERNFNARPIRRRYFFVITPVLLCIFLLAARSTLAHRPANPAFFAVTSDAMVNTLILNSTYTVEYALYNLKHEADANRVYGELSDQEVINTIQQSDHLASYKYPFKKYPTVHYQKASTHREQPLNIVVILEESLGATFVESLGGKLLTPNLERLKTQGWWFEKLYATGVRSARGIEAVIAGFPPSRARSTVKLSGSQRKFFTLADALARNGYSTQFIYGGQAHFDNMASFFVGNGFQKIIDQDQFSSPDFIGSWGVSDGDLFNMLHQQLANPSTQQPQFILAFSSSNHEPFEFPKGEIELAEQPRQTVNNAVKYADHALGEFFDKAQQSNYWRNTLFLVVADHDTRVFGNELIPINKFHIPGLILGADIKPKTIDAITSQIDLAPTLLSLAGISTFSPMIGQDLSQADCKPANRAVMQYGDNYGWLERTPVGTFLTVLRVNKAPVQFRVTTENDTLQAADRSLDETELRHIIAHAMLPSVLYQNRTYYVPPG